MDLKKGMPSSAMESRPSLDLDAVLAATLQGASMSQAENLGPHRVRTPNKDMPCICGK